MYKSVFVTDSNKDEYLKDVLTWLESDYQQRGEPTGHFWHNRNIIRECFERCEAMIAMKDNQEVVGYMIWSMRDVSAEIDIIEVKASCRRQGISKMMLADFTQHYDQLSVLTGFVIPESQHVFDNAGWQSYLDMNQTKQYYKIIKPCLAPVNTLPSGHVIALCSTNFYKVNQNPAQYADSMQYFQITLNDQAQLQTPIIARFHYEGYVAVYYNKELVTTGKAKHIFYTHNCVAELFVLDEIQPINPELFKEKGFLSAPLAIEVADDIKTIQPLTNARDIGFFSGETVAKKVKLDESGVALEMKK